MLQVIQAKVEKRELFDRLFGTAAAARNDGDGPRADPQPPGRSHLLARGACEAV